MQRGILPDETMGRESLAHENEAGSTWGHRHHVVHGETLDSALFGVITTRLFPLCL